MVRQADLVREAVLASLRVERQMASVQQPAEQHISHDAAVRLKPATSRAKPKSTEVDSNWKKLQKALSSSNLRKRRKRRTAAGPVDKEASTTSEPAGTNYSSFMKREAHHTANVTRAVAMDCEMVGVGKHGKENALARVSIVNYNGDVLYDKFVKVHERVTDYRTQWSGVRPEDVSPDSKTATELYEAQQVVGDLIKGRILVGHALKNDLRVLRLSHPWRDIRDTAEFYKKVWRKQGRRGGRSPALRVIVAQVLGVDSFQKNEHDSCEDARAALALYKQNAKEWENGIRKTGDAGNKKSRQKSFAK